jgi:hypothetical protein
MAETLTKTRPISRGGGSLQRSDNNCQISLVIFNGDKKGGRIIEIELDALEHDRQPNLGPKVAGIICRLLEQMPTGVVKTAARIICCEKGKR